MGKRVEIKVVSVGQAFGCKAEIVDCASGEVLARTESVRPHGQRHNAYADGEALAAERGWTVEAAS